MSAENTTQTLNTERRGAKLLSLSRPLRVPGWVEDARVSRLRAELCYAHVRHRKELAEKERLARRLQLLVQSLPGGVIVLDADGRVEQSNRSAIEFLGCPLRGELWREIVAEVVEPRQDDACDVSLRSGRRVNITTCSVGTEPGQLLLINDVTQARDLQSKLNHVQRLSEMGKMMGALAHQIRTPLAGALLHASNLRCRADLSEAAKGAATKIVERLRHLESLVTDMLSFVRRGNLVVDSIPVPNLLEAFTDCLARHEGVHELHLELAVESSKACVQGNLEALQSVFENLVVNATQAGGDGVTIGLHACLQGDDWLQVSLSDDGPGMPCELQERVFEPFITCRPDGVGLGLTIAKRVIETHGGSLGLHSQPGDGSRFEIRLPLCPSERSLACIPSRADEPPKRRIRA